GRRVGGGDTFCLIAGPCTVESRAQTLAVADAVKGHASMMRGGAFKPRTSPFSFQGLGADALAILREARERTGLPVVSELTDATHAEEMAGAVDVIQVARATCRTTRCSRWSASSASRCCSSAAC